MVPAAAGSVDGYCLACGKCCFGIGVRWEGFGVAGKDMAGVGMEVGKGMAGMVVVSRGNRVVGEGSKVVGIVGYIVGKVESLVVDSSVAVLWDLWFGKCGLLMRKAWWRRWGRWWS